MKILLLCQESFSKSWEWLSALNRTQGVNRTQYSTENLKSNKKPFYELISSNHKFIFKSSWSLLKLNISVVDLAWLKWTYKDEYGHTEIRQQPT